MNYIFFEVNYFFLTLSLACLTPITSKPIGNQENQQHSNENFGVSDDYESLDMKNIETSSYEILQLNKRSLKYYNTENQKCTKDHRVEGIMIN